MNAKRRRGKPREKNPESEPLLGEEPMGTERTPMPERPEPKKFNAPLWAGLVVAVGLVVVLLVNAFGHRDRLTVDALNTPAVAAVDGGSAVYPPNSELAFTENAKFGYLPAPTLTRLADGTVVAADPDTAQTTMGLSDGLAGVTTNEFLDATIAPPRENTAPGSPVTWDQLVDEISTSTVLMPLVSDTATLGPVLDTIAEAGAEKSTIVRTADGEVARAAAAAEVAVMYSGDVSAVTPETLVGGDYSMIAVPSAAVDDWLDTDLDVWVTDVGNKAELDALASRGIFGALSTNPYTIQPSAVKTN